MAFENRYNELKWAKSRTEYLEVKKDLESYNWRGDTPLIAAIRGGAIDFVEELIENNINVNQPGFLNETAAMVAAQFNQIEIAELLQAWFLLIFATERSITFFLERKSRPLLGEPIFGPGILTAIFYRLFSDNEPNKSQKKQSI